MGTTGVDRRWLELAAGVLAGPPGRDATGPVCRATGPVCRALAEDFHATAAAVIEARGDGMVLRPVGPRCPQPLDVGFYARHVRDAPALRHFLAQPYDQQVRCSQEVDPCPGDRAVERVVGRLRADGIEQWLVFPVPAIGARGPRWLVVARSAAFDERELLLARRVHPVVVGLERYAGAGQQPERPPAPVPRSLAAPGLLDAVPPQPPGRARRPQALTDRERAVLVLMAEGLITQAIGHRLGVSPRTVAKHQERIYRKLDTSDRLTTVLRAQAEGLVGAGIRATGNGSASG